MIEIRDIFENMSTDYTALKKNQKTKSIYVNNSYCNGNISQEKKIIAKNNKYSIYYEISINKEGLLTTVQHSIIIEKDDVEYKTKLMYDTYSGPYTNFIITTSEPLTILEDFNDIFYCIPEKSIELQPMPKIEKLTDSSSFEQVSSKLQEVNNLLKVGSDNLKTIMDANNLMYEPTDKFSTLIQKLNDKPNRPSTLMEGYNFINKLNSIPNIKNIKEIKFIKDIPNPNGIDVSETQDKSIMASLDNTETILIIACNNEIIANEDCGGMFDTSHFSSTLGMANINKICFDNFNTKI